MIIPQIFYTERRDIQSALLKCFMCVQYGGLALLSCQYDGCRQILDRRSQTLDVYMYYPEQTDRISSSIWRDKHFDESNHYNS